MAPVAARPAALMQVTDVSVLSPTCVLLTGFSGAVGREVVPRLLAVPGLQLVALARGGEARRAAATAEVRAYLDSSGPPVDWRRVHVLDGDLAAPHLGLSHAVRARLVARVTHVLHAAARTSLALGRRDAWIANVHGTRQLVALARRAPHLERFVHVSTAYADARSVMPPHALVHVNEYERSKLAAEQVVRGIGARRVVARPGIVVGRTHDGWLGRRCALFSTLRSLSRSAHIEVPGCPAAPLKIAPVDHVADALVRMLLLPNLGPGPYVLGSAEMRADRLLDAARAAWAGHGPARFVPSPGGVSVSVRDQALAYLRQPRSVDAAGLHDAAAVGIRVPEIADYLPNVLRFFRETDGLRRLPWANAGRPLAEAVA